MGAMGKPSSTLSVSRSMWTLGHFDNLRTNILCKEPAHQHDFWLKPRVHHTRKVSMSCINPPQANHTEPLLSVSHSPEPHFIQSRYTGTTPPQKKNISSSTQIWEWMEEEGHQWYTFSAEDSDLLQALWSTDATTQHFFACDKANIMYKINFVAMTETNLQTGAILALRSSNGVRSSSATNDAVTNGPGASGEMAVLISADEIDENQSADGPTCIICADPLADDLLNSGCLSLECGHSCCGECSARFIQGNIESGKVDGVAMQCPLRVDGCKGVILDADIEAVLTNSPVLDQQQTEGVPTGRQLFLKFQRFRKAKQNTADPTLVPCTGADCDGYLHIPNWRRIPSPSLAAGTALATTVGVFVTGILFAYVGTDDPRRIPDTSYAAPPIAWAVTAGMGSATTIFHLLECPRIGLLRSLFCAICCLIGGFAFLDGYISSILAWTPRFSACIAGTTAATLLAQWVMCTCCRRVKCTACAKTTCAR